MIIPFKLKTVIIVGIDPEEAKKKKQKEIVSRIPAAKQDLFAYSVHWDTLDDTLMSKVDHKLHFEFLFE